MELHEFPAFEHVNETQVANFCAACDRTQHSAGDELIARGEKGKKVFFLLEGEAEVYLPDPKGRRVLCTISAPAIFGEMEFLTGEPRSASVRALSEITLLGISYEVLRARISDGESGRMKLFVAKLLNEWSF
jgi:CRP-like cAMP-binding protein